MAFRLCQLARLPIAPRLVVSSPARWRQFASGHQSTPDKAFEEVAALFNRQGSSDYVGEAVSQTEHALQAAQLATVAGFDHDAVLAALLHDCGHMRGLEDPTSGRMEDCGIVSHEHIGGDWLLNLGFSERVATLVRRHVDAKRYLCCVKPGYQEALSEASTTTLRHQGGPMTPAEAAAFEKDELFKTIIAMRYWDEAAKVPNKIVPDLMSYRGMIQEHVAAQLCQE